MPSRAVAPSPATGPAARPAERPVLQEMSFLDRWLPVWILAAMAAGLLLGRLVPGLAEALDAFTVAGVSVPIALGLLVMMYPVLAKVRYDETHRIAADRRLMGTSLVLNWIVGPALMFALAWLFLADLPEYRTGLIIVGLARCIAMVLIWNDLACGDREAAVVLVAVNSVFQVVAFGALGWFYMQVLTGWLGLPTTTAGFSVGAIVLSVLVFLGVPLLAGFLTRVLGERARGRAWYEGRFLPRIGPWALYGLLFTIVLLFALQGEAITTSPGDVARIALPLLVYFTVMFLLGLVASRAVGLDYARSTTVAFTASGNNFELAIAVAIATFGVHSGQALAGVVGPLIEVPVLVGLVYVARWLAPRLFPGDPTVPPPSPPAPPGAPRDRARPDRPPPLRPVRLRPQRRSLPDGRRLAGAPLRRPRGGALRRIRAEGPDQPVRRRRDGRGRDRPEREHPEGAHHRGGAGVGRGDHHGLRGHVPGVPRQALRGLGGGGPRRPGRERRAPHPRRDPRPRRGPARGPAPGGLTRRTSATAEQRHTLRTGIPLPQEVTRE